MTEAEIEKREDAEQAEKAADGDNKGDDDAEDGAAAEAGGAKKSKNKKKRQAAAKEAAEAAAELQKASLAPTKYTGPLCGGTDEEFAAWLEKVKTERSPAINLNEEQASRLPKKFVGYKFSGTLRPHFVHTRAPPPPGVELPDYAEHEKGVSMSERQKSRDIPEVVGEELEIMRESCKLGREILDLAGRALKPGVTGDFLDRVVYHACCERNIFPSPLNYNGFPKSVCVSPNEVICHGIPDMRPIEDGDIVNLDVSIFHKGFHSDLNETFLVGNVDEGRKKVVHAAYDALVAASQMIKPGTMYRDVGSVISATAAKYGCAVVNSYTGHGVGKLFHGPPNVPHYKKNKAVGIMKPGHIFTIEPMLNLGGDGGDLLWPDNWTAVSSSGKPSAQFEHTFLVTETGFEVLTARRGAPIDAMPAYNPEEFQR
jgi:methionyl aminopeptidase